MTIVVTAGSASANAYISLPDCDDYHSARGNATWTGDDEDKEAAIIRAAQALDGRYRHRFTGYKATKAQAMAWPRKDAVDADDYDFEDDEIPPNLISANAEAALLELVTPGILAPTYTKGVRSKIEKVDVISESTTYGSEYKGSDSYATIENLMNDIISVSGFEVPIARA